MLKRIVSISMVIVIIFTFLGFGIEEVKASYCDEFGHYWSNWSTEDYATCTEPGKEYRYCYECYQEETRLIPANGHDWEDWKILRKATSYHKGKKERYCQECYEHEVKVIPKRALTNNETKAKRVVAKYLKCCKKFNYKKVKSCFHNNKKYVFYFDSTIKKYLKKHNKRIKWTIKDISGSGNKIKVKARVKYANLYKVSYNAIFNAVKDYGDGKIGKKDIEDRFWTNYINGLRKAKYKTRKKTFTFTVIKKHGKWKIKKRTKSIIDIATGRFYEGYDDAGISAAFYLLLTQKTL